MDTFDASFRSLHASVHGDVLQIVLNRTHVLNAVNFEMALELHRLFDAIAALQQQKSEDRALLLSSVILMFQGGCVGVDIGAADADEEWDYRGIHSQQLLSSLVEKLYRLPVAVVCVADGPVVGLGLALWLASDLRLATARSTFRCGFSSLGISNCDMGVSWLLPKVVGYPTASRMMLVHDIIPAKEAFERDLAHFIDTDLRAAQDRAHELVARMTSQHSRQGLNLTKKQLKTGAEGGTSLAQAVVAENAIQTYLLGTDEVQSRARAMLAELKRNSDGRRSKL